LIPFQLNTSLVVLAGDSQQSAPYVFSRSALNASYGVSLPERLLLNGHPVHRLCNQYRMHPTICDVACDLFYGTQLRW
jgi:superfamily I DNA and/or RNA helicase